MVSCEKVTEYVGKLCREVEDLRRENAELRAELRTYKPRTRRSKGASGDAPRDSDGATHAPHASEKSRHRD